jgi:hypothetical protein
VNCKGDRPLAVCTPTSDVSRCRRNRAVGIGLTRAIDDSVGQDAVRLLGALPDLSRRTPVQFRFEPAHQPLGFVVIAFSIGLGKQPDPGRESPGGFAFFASI